MDRGYFTDRLARIMCGRPSEEEKLFEEAREDLRRCLDEEENDR